jgi:hypothetical protein
VRRNKRIMWYWEWSDLICQCILKSAPLFRSGAL